jgi:predicted DsbA family dithiol-disulfide isomerase
VSSDNASTLEIDVFSDIVCPWCFVGSERLERVLRTAPDAAPVAVTYHPFFLMPDTPPAGLDVQDYLRRKYGAEPRLLFARVEAAARDTGIALDLTKQPRSYPTLRAHTLLRHALDRGTQRDLTRALFRSYFLDARDISDVEVLSEVAGPHGFTAAQVRELLENPDELALTEAETKEAQRLGIRGVPFFVFNGRFAVSGAQPEAVFEDAMKRASQR